MALFKRKKSESVMPEEVQNFYAAERRQRKGTAWLLAIVTLLVTFLIASALFFGGRWIYRAIFDNDDKASTSQNESIDDQKSQEKTDSETAPSSSTTSQTPSSGSSSNQNSSSSSSTNNAANSGSTAQNVPAAGPSELVNTGPGDENW